MKVNVRTNAIARLCAVGVIGGLAIVSVVTQNSGVAGAGAGVAPSPVEIAQRVEALDFPFAAYPHYGAASSALQTALIDECVAGFGIPVPISEGGASYTGKIGPSWTDLWLLQAGDYGAATLVSDPGFASFAQELSRGAAGANAVSPPSATEDRAYMDAVYGDPGEWIEFELPNGMVIQRPVGGCFGEVTKTMYGIDDPAEYERLYFAVPRIQHVIDQTMADRAVQRSVGEWAKCMETFSIAVDTPDSLLRYVSDWINGAAAGSLSGSDVRRMESEMAAADAACRDSSGLAATVGTTFISIADGEISDKESAINRYREMIDHSLQLMN